MPVTCHFLIVYNHEQQRLVSVQNFPDAKAAVTAYEAAEEQHRHEHRLEIVLVGADSLDTIKVTHGHYFRDAASPTASRY